MKLVKFFVTSKLQSIYTTQRYGSAFFPFLGDFKNGEITQDFTWQAQHYHGFAQPFIVKNFFHGPQNGIEQNKPSRMFCRMQQNIINPSRMFFGMELWYRNSFRIFCRMEKNKVNVLECSMKWNRMVQNILRMESSILWRIGAQPLHSQRNSAFSCPSLSEFIM